MNYRGRFAPSPTGPLHLGSLIAALASYLDARHANGTWLVRMEDLDPPREEAGAADLILQTLQQHALHWDESVVYQSRRHQAYSDALQQLNSDGRLFYCDCTRAMQGPEGNCCGNCSYRQEWVGEPRAIRVRVPSNLRIRFSDQVQGEQASELSALSPDFIVKRKDGLNAYQLAVVIDDGAQEITHIVRGCDLLDSTPRQIFLQQILGLATPSYSHLPVITTLQGHKFSKQNHAPGLDNCAAPANLRRALQFLKQPEPPADCSTAEQILKYATAHWQLGLVPSVEAIPASASQLAGATLPGASA